MQCYFLFRCDFKRGDPGGRAGGGEGPEILGVLRKVAAAAPQHPPPGPLEKREAKQGLDHAQQIISEHLRQADKGHPKENKSNPAYRMPPFTKCLSGTMINGIVLKTGTGMRDRVGGRITFTEHVSESQKVLHLHVLLLNKINRKQINTWVRKMGVDLKRLICGKCKQIRNAQIDRGLSSCFVNTFMSYIHVKPGSIRLHCTK